MNKPFVMLSRFFTALVVIAFAASALADVVYVPFVTVDVNGYNNSKNKNFSGTLSGYNTMNFANATLSSTVTINPDVSVKVDRVSTTKNRDRESSKGDALTNDFIFEQNTSQPITVTLNGLTVGKEYSLKIYSQDITSNVGTSGTWNITQGETTEQIGVQTNTTSATSYKITDPATYLAYTFTASANTAVLTGLATNQFVFLNGIELSEAYDPASGYTYFDVNSNQKDGSETRIISPRATELFVDNNNKSNTATATAPSGIKITVTSNDVLDSRTRNKTNSAADMNLYNDFLFSRAKQPFTVTLDNLSTNAVYRLTVHSFDPYGDQSAGVWTMTDGTITDGNNATLFSVSHTPDVDTPATWSFNQYINPGTSTVEMTAALGSKDYTMFNGLELQVVRTLQEGSSVYSWTPGRTEWLVDGKWVKKDGTSGTPQAGDVCYVVNTTPSTGNADYWINTTTDPFEGTLIIGTGSRLICKKVNTTASATANDLILDGGELFDGEGNTTFTLNGALTVLSDSTVYLKDSNTRTLQIASAISGTADLTVLGKGTSSSILILTNSNAGYSGKFILDKATLKLSGSGALGTGTVVDNGNLEFAHDSAQTFSNVISGTGTVSKTGSGTLTLTGINTFTGGTTISTGTLKLSESGTLGTGTVVDNGILEFAHDSARTFSNVISGTGALSKTGSGTLTLTGASTYTGGTTISNGTLILSGNDACFGSGGLDISSTSQLTLNGPHYGLHSVNSLTGSGPISVTATSRFDLASSAAQTYSGTISVSDNQSLHVGYTISGDKSSNVNLPNATISLASGANLGLIHQSTSSKQSSLVIGTLNGVSDSVVRASGSVNASGSKYATLTVGKGDFAGVIGGSNTSHNKMRLVKNTDGTLTLSGANTYIGGTDIQAGKIVLTSAGTLGTGTVTIGENGTLEFNVAEGPAKKMTISSKITSAGKITKTGEGTLQLYAAAEGLVNASSFVVSSGRLDMKEYFSGTLEIGNGAEFSPGNSVGTLNVNGTFKADAYSTLIFEQDASGMDKLTASAFDINPNAEIQLDITALIPGATYDVIVNTSETGFTQEQGSETFWTNLMDDGLLYYVNLSVVDNHIVRMQIDANAVPEPSTWALLALGVAVLFLRKRS